MKHDWLSEHKGKSNVKINPIKIVKIEKKFFFLLKLIDVFDDVIILMARYPAHLRILELAVSLFLSSSNDQLFLVSTNWSGYNSCNSASCWFKQSCDEVRTWFNFWICCNHQLSKTEAIEPLSSWLRNATRALKFGCLIVMLKRFLTHWSPALEVPNMSLL